MNISASLSRPLVAARGRRGGVSRRYVWRRIVDRWQQWRERVRNYQALALLDGRDLDRIAADMGLSPAALRDELSRRR